MHGKKTSDELERLRRQAEPLRMLGGFCTAFLFMLPVAVAVGLTTLRNGWWLLPWLGSSLIYAGFRNAQEARICDLEWSRHRESESKSSGPINGYYDSLSGTFASFCVVSVPWAVYLAMIA